MLIIFHIIPLTEIHMKPITRISLACVVAAGSWAATGAFAQEQGRVISTTPVISQVAVPRQVCSNEQVTTQSQQKSGAGALMGGVAGAAAARLRR
jgi:uncharacterized protein YcfJ